MSGSASAASVSHLRIGCGPLNSITQFSSAFRWSEVSTASWRSSRIRSKNLLRDQLAEVLVTDLGLRVRHHEEVVVEFFEPLLGEAEAQLGKPVP